MDIRPHVHVHMSTPSTKENAMDVNDIVAAKIAAARARAEATKRRRATQQAARQAGLTARHAAKLRNLRGSEAHADALSTTEPTEGTTP